MDAIHYKVKEDNAMPSKAVYLVIGLGQDGVKDLLGIYVCHGESANFWLGVMNEIHRRGVEDILIANMDNLKGLSKAVNAVFPRTNVQSCIVHQIRSSLKYVAQKDRNSVVRDLKMIYRANDRQQTERELGNFGQA
jgi:transposase-like protein